MIDKNPYRTLHARMSPPGAAWDEGFVAADSWWRSRLASDETVEAVAQTESFRGGPCLCSRCNDERADVRHLLERALASLLPVNEPEPVPTQRITHGRHCTCTPCRVEDWTNPALAPCGMHGRDCPREYAPLGGAGQVVPVNEPETDT